MNMKGLLKKLVFIAAAIVMGLGATFGLTACGGKDKIVVYTEAGFAPFEYLVNRNIVGVDVDIMNLVGKKLGREVVFENVDFDTIIDSVSQGSLCKVGAAGISVTEERKTKVDFSNEYYTAKLCVVYRVADESEFLSDTTDGVMGVFWDSLADKKIAVQEGTTADIIMSDELDENGTLEGTGAAPIRFDALSTALADVKVGNSDVFIIDELPAQKLVEKEDGFRCAPLYYKGDGNGTKDRVATEVYAICVTKGEYDLLNAINEVIKELGKDGVEELVKNHLNVN